MTEFTFRGHRFQIPADPSGLRWLPRSADFVARYQPTDFGTELFNEYADEQSVRDQYWQVEPGEQVIDVGCRWGSYTMSALACGASVLAIDPNPQCCEVLTNLAALNGFGDRLQVMERALFDGGAYPADLMASLMSTPHGGLAPAPDAVFATLDRLAAGMSRVDWVKIDVEGGELGVLEGGRQTLIAHHPRLLVEDHSAIYPGLVESHHAEKILGLLNGYGYVLTEIPYQGFKPKTIFRTIWYAEHA